MIFDTDTKKKLYIGGGVLASVVILYVVYIVFLKKDKDKDNKDNKDKDVDCVLSNWSNWTCNSGKLTRNRNVITPALNNGKSCSSFDLIELSNVNCTQWTAGNNGSVSCEQYCKGQSGNSWNNELPSNWSGAKCIATMPVGNCATGYGSSQNCLCEATGTGWNV